MDGPELFVAFAVILFEVYKMSQSILKENHFSLTSTADIVDICNPLF